MDQYPWWMWVGFNLFVLAMLALDLGVFHRKDHEVKFKEAVGWTVVWIALAMVFNLLLLFNPGGFFATPGHEKQIALEFLSAYLIEKSLSVDNIFVFILLFTYFKVPTMYQHRVLFYGILGALVMRAALIFAGLALIKQFHWMIYVFGVFLFITGLKMLFAHGQEVEPEKNMVLKLFKRFVPVTSDYRGRSFFVRENGVLFATPLFVVLLLIEFTDLVFALDSIPAVIAITRNEFIVYTSNVFAILGLRALYFALGGFMNKFHFLGYGLAAVLMFVGVKMLISDFYKFHTAVSLGIIATLITISVIASVMFPEKEEHAA